MAYCNHFEPNGKQLKSTTFDWNTLYNNKIFIEVCQSLVNSYAKLGDEQIIGLAATPRKP